MEIPENKLIKAVMLITNTLERNKIDKVTGACAMLSILETLKKEGIDIGIEGAVFCGFNKEN